MSSDVDVDDEQVLPESLQKLEIVPIYSSHTAATCKSANEQNPFYTVPGMDSASTNERIVKLFGPSCSDCGSKNNMGDVTDGSKASRSSTRSTGNASHGNCPSNSIEHGIQKPIHFKHRDKEKNAVLSEKKLLILRDPILKMIGRSVHHNHVHSMSSTSTIASSRVPVCCGEPNLPTESVASGSYNRNFVPIRNRPIPAGIDSTSSATTTNEQNWRLQREQPIDFKSLVTDCSNMSLSSALDATSDSSQSFGMHRTKCVQWSQPNASVNVNSELDSSGIANVNSNVMNTSMSSNSSNSSTCSQQARMNSSNCDVTIDELASYFETFVHIPKKMSSMAEMMYI